jgi:guanyl-specific ribonuclease Sa
VKSYPTRIDRDHDNLIAAAGSMRALAGLASDARTRMSDVQDGMSKAIDGEIGNAVSSIVSTYRSGLDTGYSTLLDCAWQAEQLANELSNRQRSYERTLWDYNMATCSVADDARSKERSLAWELDQKISDVKRLRNSAADVIHELALKATRAEQEHYSHTFFGQVEGAFHQTVDYMAHDFVNDTLHYAGDVLIGTWHAAKGFVVGTVKLVYGLSIIQFVVDPEKWVHNVVNLVKGVGTLLVITNPLSYIDKSQRDKNLKTIKAMVNWDEVKDRPGLLAGEILFNVLLIGATMGAGAAVEGAGVTAEVVEGTEAAVKGAAVVEEASMGAKAVEVTEGAIDASAAVIEPLGGASYPRFVSAPGGTVIDTAAAGLKEQIDTVASAIESTGRPPIGVQQGGRSFPGVFENSEGALPTKPLGYYSESDVWASTNSSRGTERIVVGKNGEVWYTPDHYGSFRRIK